MFGFIAHMIGIASMWIGGGLIACMGQMIGCMLP